MVTPGRPFLWTADVVDARGTESAAVLPTLFQAISDAYARQTMEFEFEDKIDLKTLAADVALRYHDAEAYPLPLLPHPDFSRIVIRRFDADGKESRIPVDLTKFSDEGLTPEAARKADVQLQAWDIIELSLLDPLPPTPWQGFTPLQSNLFRKALSGQCLFHNDREIVHREFTYQPPVWYALPSGILALRPAQGIPSTIISEFDGKPFGGRFERAGGRMGLERDGNRYFIPQGKELFIRDGDKIGNR